MIDDQRQALPRPSDVAASYRPSIPGLHIDASVAVGDHRGQTLLERLVHATIDRRPVLAVAIDEAAVERREQPPPLVLRNRDRSAHRRVRRFVAARVPSDRGAGVIEPRDVRDDARIVELGTKRRHEHRRLPGDERTCALPHRLTGQRMREDRPNVRRMQRGEVNSLRPRRGRDSHRGKDSELRPALLRRLPAVVVMLDRIDQPVAMVTTQPLDAPWPQRQTRRLQHRRRVRVDGHNEQHGDREHHPAQADPPPTACPRRMRVDRQVDNVGADHEAPVKTGEHSTRIARSESSVLRGRAGALARGHAARRSPLGDRLP